MGYTTYRPDKVADKPIVTIKGVDDDVLTITYLESASDEMRQYWNMGDEGWYWVSLGEGKQGIPIPAHILIALCQIGSAYRRNSQETDNITLVHKNVHYFFHVAYWFNVYPAYHKPEDGTHDKRPRLDECDIEWNKILDIMQVAVF